MHNEQYQAIRNAAMKLSEKDRAILAGELYISIDPASREEIEASWAEEAERRIAALERGETTLVDGDSIMQALKEGRIP